MKQIKRQTRHNFSALDVLNFLQGSHSTTQPLESLLNEACHRIAMLEHHLATVVTLAGKIADLQEKAL